MHQCDLETLKLGPSALLSFSQGLKNLIIYFRGIFHKWGPQTQTNNVKVEQINKQQLIRKVFQKKEAKQQEGYNKRSQELTITTQQRGGKTQQQEGNNMQQETPAKQQQTTRAQK